MFAEIGLNGSDWQLLPLLPREWEKRKVWQPEFDPSKEFPALDTWIGGSVPGDIIADALDAGLISDPFFEENSRHCEWLSQRDWVYRRSFSAPDLPADSRTHLHFEGVDHECRIYLNGVFLGSHEGQNLPFDFDVTSVLQSGTQNTLVVIVMHAPPVDQVQGQVGRTSEARVWKARYAYGWDWCTRLIPLGIWREVSVRITGPVIIAARTIRPRIMAKPSFQDNPVPGFSDSRAETWVEIEVSVSPALQAATPLANYHLQLAIELSGHGLNAESRRNIAFPTPDGTTHKFFIGIESPQYWWPNGMGSQPLYSCRILVTCDDWISHETRDQIGLRSLTMVKNSGGSPDALPYTPMVNGKGFFIKGYNWVPIDHSVGRDQAPGGEARYRRLLEMARDSHVNLLRVWGGGFLESRRFYELCDEMGILVWQEFMMSSSGIDNHPPSDSEFLNYVKFQAKEFIPQRFNHASLLLWCGGNELMDESMNPLDESHPALGVLRQVVSEKDHERAWLPASPSGPAWHSDPKIAGQGKMHDVHGPWIYGGAIGHYEHYNGIDPLLHSEFGVEGCANLETLDKYCSPERQWPPDRTNSAWVHHGSWWLKRDSVEALFGPINNIEDFVEASQWLQAEGLRYAVESHRRNWPRCSGCLPWQFNEAFPNYICTNVVDYLGMPKPAYFAVKNAYALMAISLKYERLAWRTDEKWSAEVWVVSDVFETGNTDKTEQESGWSIEISNFESGELMLTDEGKVFLTNHLPQLVKKVSCHPGPGVFEVKLKVVDGSNGILATNRYWFACGRPHAPLGFMLGRIPNQWCV